MMGVYIKNIKKPKTERQCQFYDEDPFGIRKPYCKIQNVCNGLDDCPLISVPPHGRLIDADAVCKRMCELKLERGSIKWDMATEVITQMAMSPTIIESKP
jgi:hypothetical protein